MLILAGVTISIMNNAGILKNSQSAADKYEISDEQDVISVAFSTVFANSALTDNDITPEMLQKELDKTTRKTIVRKSSDEGKENLLYIKFNKTKNEHSIDITNGHIDYVGPYSEITVDILKDGIITISAEPTEFTNGNVTVTISYTLPEDKKGETDKIQLQYALSGAPNSWKQYTGQLTIEENMVVYARLSYLNETTEIPASLTIGNIDKLPPKAFTPSITKTTNQITVTANTTDAEATNQYACSGLAGYSFSKDGGKTWTAYQTSGTHQFTDLTQNTTYKIQVKAKDAAGNETRGNIDVTTEGITGLDIQVANADIWTTSKIVTITANNSNYQTIRYTTNGTAPTATTGTAITSGGTFTINSNCQIYAIAYDSTNQAGATASYKVTKIDTTKPEIKTATATTNTITFNATDNIGVVAYAITESNTAPTTGWTTVSSTTSYSTTVNNKVQNKTYYIWAKDEAGNVNNSKSVKTSQVAGLTINVSNADTWTKTKTVTITANDSNYQTIRYTINGTAPTATTGTTITSGGTFTINSNCQIYAIAYDNTNQAGATASYKVTKIDNAVPATPRITNPSGGNWTNQNVILTVSSSDTGSGINRLEYSYDKNTWKTDWGYNYTTSGTTKSIQGSWNAERNNEVFVRAVDNAGNVSGISSTWIKIDKTAPENLMYSSHSYSDSVNNHWNEPIPAGWTVAIAVKKGASGIAKVEFADSNGGPVTITRTDLTDDGDTSSENCWLNSWNGFPTMPNHDYWARATDNAGNVGPWVRIPVKPKYTVTLTPGTGTSVSGGGTYYVGQTVTVRATALTGYTFSNWSGTYSSNSAVYSFTMPASNVSLTANARVNTYNITVDTNGGSTMHHYSDWNVTGVNLTKEFSYGQTTRFFSEFGGVCPGNGGFYLNRRRKTF